MKRLTMGRLISVFAMLTLILSGCGEPFLSTLKPAGEVAKSQYNLMLLATAIMVGVILVVVIIFLIVIFRFRRKGDDKKIPKQVEGSHTLEILWTAIPIILLLILAVPTVSSTFKLADTAAMEKKKSNALVVNVRSSLYWWEFEYPNEGIITGQELVVPTDEKVYFNLKASDIKHSFWIPAVGGKMDTNIDNVNKFWLEFDSKKAEEAKNMFYGKCTELCGPSHALMDFKVKAVSRAEFDQWVKDMKKIKEPAKPDTASAQEGQQIFNKSCIGCHAVTPVDPRPEAARQAPSLANFGDRNRIAGFLKHDKENLKHWIEKPQELKPGNKMPAFQGQFDEKQLDALADYLMGLKVEGK